mmetsp:Transcript_6963/g.10640  ORF Transcript_6963/g.10640 Transcript_6963/m.10640 type:complete len:158 (+) Transcript_6963:290-763(+)
MDAYSKISIIDNSNSKRVTRRNPITNGIRNVVLTENDDSRIESPDQPRVLLDAVSKEMGKQGATKGDVVSFVNGQNVNGLVAARVQDVIRQHSSTEPLVLVLNAERSVAEALKRRSIAMKKERDQTRHNSYTHGNSNNNSNPGIGIFDFLFCACFAD